MSVDDGDWMAVEGRKDEGDGGRMSQGRLPMGEVLVRK